MAKVPEMKMGVVLLLSSMFFTSCVMFAPPSPMLTYGGPETTPKKSSELALGLGTAGVRFEGAHTPAQGWFGRYKYGLSHKLDIGLDMLGARRNGGQYFGVKSIGRYQLTDYSRLEVGIGAADDSDGKSINGDMVFTVGTTRDKEWNYYSSLRYGYSKGFAGNAAFADDSPVNQFDNIVPPNAHFLLINLGAEAEVSINQKFIFEGGYGYVILSSNESAPVFFISIGILFNVGK